MEGMGMSAIQGLLTVYETARLIGVSHAQVTRYVKQGLLPAKRVGQTILIDERDAKRFSRPPRGNPRLQKSF
jgi:excisionase family DNA binding protein